MRGAGLLPGAGDSGRTRAFGRGAPSGAGRAPATVAAARGPRGVRATPGRAAGPPAPPPRRSAGPAGPVSGPPRRRTQRLYPPARRAQRVARPPGAPTRAPHPPSPRARPAASARLPEGPGHASPQGPGHADTKRKRRKPNQRASGASGESRPKRQAVQVGARECKPKAPAALPGEGRRAGPSVTLVDPCPRGERRPRMDPGCRSGADERGPALVLPASSQEVQPLRDATLEASADFLLAAWFLWMTPFETALSS